MNTKIFDKIKKLIFNFKIFFFKKNSIDLENKIYKESLLNDKDKHKLILERTQNILNEAYNNTEFYKFFYDLKNFDIKNVKTYEDIKNIPIITKSDIKIYNHLIKIRK